MTDRYGWLRVLIYLFVLILGLMSLNAQAQTHNFCPTDGNCAWTGAHIFTGNGTGGVGTAAGGAVNIQKASSPSAIFMGRAVDIYGNTNAQLIGWNVEQMVNPTSTVNYINLAYSGELVIPIGNTQAFTASQAAADFALVNYGSGAWTGNTGIAVVGEAWNSGPATSILELDGVAGGCHNGSVSAGIPVQTPTGNGSVTNCRAVSASVTNSSSGVITNADGVYVNSATNTGGGSITNLHGLRVLDQTAGSSNWAIQTGLGKVQFGDETHFDKSFTQGTGAASTSIGSQLIPALSGATNQTGLQMVASSNSSATTAAVGIVARADVAASTTQVSNQSFVAQDASKGSGASITSSYGFYANARTSGTTNFGYFSETGNIDSFDKLRARTSFSLGSIVLMASAAPTVSSGFGTSPTIANNNGTAAFTVNVGTGGTASSGVIGLPTAATGWNCFTNNITASAGHRADNTRQTASSTTSATIENQTISTGAALAWTASDIVRVSCFAY